MVTKENVVLVVGAGASVPYGYDAAANMTKGIIEHSRDENSKMCKMVRLAVKGDPDPHQLGRALDLSDEESIDAFLERECNRVYRDVGRACIAWYMLHQEAAVLRKAVIAEEDWIKILINRLRQDVRTPSQLALNRVRIITFNFDYLIERRWRSVMVHGMRLQGKELDDACNSLEVIHVNGCMTAAQTPTRRLREFGDDFDYGYVKACYPHIGLFHDERQGDEACDKAADALFESNVVAFLGFSFHPTNLRRIGIPGVFEKLIEKGYELPRVYATRYGMLTHERQMAHQRVVGDVQQMSVKFAKNPQQDSAFLLREFPILDTGSAIVT
jgi:hypothetical protein